MLIHAPNVLLWNRPMTARAASAPVQAQTTALPALSFEGQKTPDKALLGAARRGDVAAMAKALKEGADINIQNPDDKRGWTPLITAAVNKQEKAVEWLLAQKGIQVNAGDNHNRTALSHVASRYDKIYGKLVALLVQHGANPALKDDYGKTAASYAASTSAPSKVKSLLGVGSSLQPNALLTHACFVGDVTLVAKALGDGAKTGTRKGWDTPLMIAARKGHTDIVELLIKNKANVHAVGDVKNDRQPTAVSIAAKAGHIEVVELLLKAGAEPAPENIGALHYNGVSQAPKLKKTIETLFKQYDGQLKPNTRLFLASARGDVADVQKALDAGADVNFATETTNTAFLTAAARGQVEVMKLLVENGADPKGAQKAYFHPAGMAADHNHPKALEYLLDQGYAKADDVLRKSSKLSAQVLAVLKAHGATNRD